MLKGSLFAFAVVLLVIACSGGGAGPVGGTGTDGGPDGGLADGAATDGAASDGAPSDGSPSDSPAKGDAASCGSLGGPSSSSYTDEAACLQDVDCTYVMAGCYCGEQPALGVAKIHSVTATACQEKAQQNCGLGCANFPGIRAEDGRTDADGGAVAVHCLKDAGANGLCRTTIE